jgi:hypothetical protein
MSRHAQGRVRGVRTVVTLGAAVLALFCVAAAPLVSAASIRVDITVTGQVLYGSANGAQKAAVVDIVEVYNNNPAYIRLKRLGLSETEGRGKRLFGEARTTANKALAAVARHHGVDVITVPGGVEGDGDFADLTREIIDQLPIFVVEGDLLTGTVKGAQSLGELDSPRVLEAIPAYLEWRSLTENDARYHLLRQVYLEKFSKAVKKVARDQGLDGVASKGDVTSRLGPVPDVTDAVIQALAP